MFSGVIPGRAGGGELLFYKASSLKARRRNMKIRACSPGKNCQCSGGIYMWTEYLKQAWSKLHEVFCAEHCLCRSPTVFLTLHPGLRVGCWAGQGWCWQPLSVCVLRGVCVSVVGEGWQPRLSRSMYLWRLGVELSSGPGTSLPEGTQKYGN